MKKNPLPAFLLRKIWEFQNTKNKIVIYWVIISENGFQFLSQVHALYILRPRVRLEGQEYFGSRGEFTKLRLEGYPPRAIKMFIVSLAPKLKHAAGMHLTLHFAYQYHKIQLIK